MAGEIFSRHKLRFKEIENESVREHLEPGDLYILTTQGMCDCGTVLGSHYREEGLSTEDKESSGVRPSKSSRREVGATPRSSGGFGKLSLPKKRKSEVNSSHMSPLLRLHRTGWHS